jgi:hypothetical protein
MVQTARHTPLAGRACPGISLAARYPVLGEEQVASLQGEDAVRGGSFTGE